MRMLLAVTCSAGVAVVLASPATADAPSPGAPSDAAIAQYVEAVPSVSGPVPVGEPADATTLPPAVRAKVEQTAGADAPLLIDITADSRFGARPVARANPAAGTAHAVPRRLPHSRPSCQGRLQRRHRRPVPADSCSSPSCLPRLLPRASPVPSCAASRSSGADLRHCRVPRVDVLTTVTTTCCDISCGLDGRPLDRSGARRGR